MDENPSAQNDAVNQIKFGQGFGMAPAVTKKVGFFVDKPVLPAPKIVEFGNFEQKALPQFGFKQALAATSEQAEHRSSDQLVDEQNLSGQNAFPQAQKTEQQQCERPSLSQISENYSSKSEAPDSMDSGAEGVQDYHAGATALTAIRTAEVSVGSDTGMQRVRSTANVSPKQMVSDMLSQTTMKTNSLAASLIASCKLLKVNEAPQKRRLIREIQEFEAILSNIRTGMAEAKQQHQDRQTEMAAFLATYSAQNKSVGLRRALLFISACACVCGTAFLIM